MSCTVALNVALACLESAAVHIVTKCWIRCHSSPPNPFSVMELSAEKKEGTFSKLLNLLASIPVIPRTPLWSKSKIDRRVHAPNPKTILLDGLDPESKYDAPMIVNPFHPPRSNIKPLSSTQYNGADSKHSGYTATIEIPVPSHIVKLASNVEHPSLAIRLEAENENVAPEAEVEHPNSAIGVEPGSENIAPESEMECPSPAIRVDRGSENVAPEADIEQNIVQPHIKQLSEGWYVDLSLALPEDLLRMWSSKLHQRLRNILTHEMGESHFSLECHMLGSWQRLRPEPTILVMCMSSADKTKIEDILRRRSCVPRNFRRQVLVLDVELCSFGILHGSYFPRELIGSDVNAICSQREERRIIFGNVSEICAQAQKNCVTSLFTIGGVITIEQVLYGLTVGHCVRIARRNERDSTNLSGITQ